MDDITRTFASLGTAELQLGADDDLLLLSDLFHTDDLILGFYTEEGLRYALRRYGMYDQLADIGFDDVKVDAAPHANGYQINVTSVDGERLVHVVFDRARLDLGRVVNQKHGIVSPEVLYVHWVLLQNPCAKFSERRPPLPAQAFPGLGFGRQVFELLANVARRLGLEGLSAIPMQFHNAYFYDIGFEYADPIYQGRFEAMVRDGVEFYRSYYGFSKEMAVCAASWAFQFEMVTDQEGDPVKWFTEPMVSPVSSNLHNYFRSEWFREIVAEASDTNRYRLPREALLMNLDRAGIRPIDAERFSEFSNRDL